MQSSSKTPYAVAGGAAWSALAFQADALGGAALGGLGFGLLHAVRGIGTLARTSALDQIGMTVGMTLGVMGVALALEAG